MKFEFIENKGGTNLTMTPETPAETAALLRFTKSSKKQLFNVSFRFHEEIPYCYMFAKKLENKNQHNYINNSKN